MYKRQRIVNGRTFGGSFQEVLFEPGEYEKFQSMLDAADSLNPLKQPEEYALRVGKAFEYVRELTQAADYADQYEVYTAGQEAMKAINDAAAGALDNPGLQDTIAMLTGDAAKDVEVMNNIADLAAAAGQGAATAATVAVSYTHLTLPTKRIV